MNTKTLADSASWIATITAFVFACVGIFSQPPALETPRPKLPAQDAKQPITAPEATGPRTAQSWDDPFAVFKPSEQLPPQTEPIRNAPTLLLVVLTGIGKYQIDSEARLRNRYAIQSALRDSGYIGESPGELTAFPLTLDKISIQIPVESFRRRVVHTPEQTDTRENAYCYVKVAWLPEPLLAKDKLQQLFSLLKENESDVAPQHKKDKMDLCVLGPTDSNTLARICENEQRPSYSPPSDGPSIYPRILNFQATAATPMVRIFALQESKPDEYYGAPRQKIISDVNQTVHNLGLNDLLATGEGTPIERVGADDFELCERLVSELNRRTITTGLGRRRILLIAEWDTFYGRAAALAFQLAAAGIKSGQLLEAAINGQTAKDFNIDCFYYMRGLDGTATLYSKAYPSESPSAEGHRQPKTEPAEGVCQFDYIRRLSDYIGEPVNLFSPTLKQPDAIVMLGTDVYDKLTLLKLLRDRFPQSLYLTTDLDALYWHPEYVRYTRNLIVASSFPLEIVDTCFRGNVASAEEMRNQWLSGVALDKLMRVKNFRRVIFRDSYQTALYYSTQCAVNKAAVPEWWRTPKLFEVGNSRPVRLDNPVWANLTAQSFWDGYIQGVNAWPSLVLQTMIVLVGFCFLARLRTVKFAQRCVPQEYYDNVKLRLADDFHPAIDEFRRITEEILNWSSTLFPNQLKLNSIFKRLTDLAASVNEIDTLPGSLARREREQLLKSLRKIILHFGPNATDQTNRLNGNVKKAENAFLRRYRLRSLRVKPWWIMEIVVPVLRAVGSGSGKSDEEIVSFSRYASPLGFAKNKLYIGILIIGILIAAIYVYYNPNFEGIVGAELRDVGLRWYRVLVAFFGVGVIVAVVTWTCFEQWRCRGLVERLMEGVGERSALQDRQIVTVIAERSNTVSHLSWKPCILIFLFYVAHLRVFVGPPFDLLHWLLFAGFLTPVSVVFFLLSGTAFAARRRVVSQYEHEILTAKRLNARLASVLDNVGPLQDDLESTASLINEFATQSSNVSFAPARGKVTPEDLGNATKRQAVRDYLGAVIARNETILAGIADLRSGAFSPLAVSSILGALLIPVGGAGGLSLLEYIVNQVR
jgi:hypothetical protein